MDIGHGITAIGQALGLAKQLLDIHGRLNNAELKARLADLYSSLADAKIALADAQTSLREKDELIAELRGAAEREPTVRLHHGFPFTVENGRVDAGPHCPNCYERKALVLLARGNTAVLKVCPRCKGEFRHTPMRSGLQDRLDQDLASAAGGHPTAGL